MRRILLIIMLLGLCVGAQAKSKKELVILHTNDTHSCIMPLSENLANKKLAGRAGAIRRVNMGNEVAHDLLLDSGDWSQGSAYYTLFKGDVEAGMLNLLGVDATTLGNHEFDNGLENLARLIKMLDCPVVCANYDFTNTPCEGLVKEYTVIKRKGLKIGVFGLSPDLNGLVDKKNFEGAIYKDPRACAGTIIDILRTREKCDVVICISHLGWRIDYEEEWFESIYDQRVIPTIEGVDLWLGGHSHTYMDEMEYVADASGKLVPVELYGKHGAFVG